MPLKLNIGAGDTEIEGYAPVDRRRGSEAYPLSYGDGTVDEIRASHILEHFPVRQVPVVLRDWVRALKPGGRIRIAVPDLDWISSHREDPRWTLYLMGGQVDENDYHRSVFSEPVLRRAMEEAGVIDIKPWKSENTDCAALPCSLNLEGIKAEGQAIKIVALMSLPRLGWNDHWGIVIEALSPFKIPIRRYTGAFWGQCLQRALEDAAAENLDWIITIDYDSMFTAKDLDKLFGHLGSNRDIDAISALQPRRGHGTALVSSEGKTEIQIDGRPIKVSTAHFGLTIIRMDALRAIPKPWFWSQPAPDGGWGTDRVDDDIWFWKQWEKAGKSIYLAPDVRIGHLEVMVAEFDDKYELAHTYVPKWINARLPNKVKSDL